MKKKLVAIISVVAMLVTIIPTTAFAETIPGCSQGNSCTIHEAAIGSTHFDTLEEAFNAAVEGNEIILLKNVSAENVVNVEKSVTLNLNGHIIFNNVKNDKLFMVSAETFTVLGEYNGSGMSIPTDNTESNGFIDFTTENGVLTLDGGTYEGKTAVKDEEDNYPSFVTIRKSGVKLNLINVTASSNRDIVETNTADTMEVQISGGVYNVDIRAFHFDIIDCVNSPVIFNGVDITTKRGPCVEMSGGAVKFENCNFKVTGEISPTNAWSAAAIGTGYGSTVTVESGTYTGTNYGFYVYSSGSDVTINGGTFTGETAIRADISEDYHANYGWNALITINEGTFNGELATASKGESTKEYEKIIIRGGNFNDMSGETLSEYNIEITGGSFPIDVSSYVPEGNKMQGSSGNYEVILDEERAVAQINSAGYLSLESAINAAEPGDTVTILKKIELDEKLVINEDITLDLNGKEITASETFEPKTGDNSHLIEITKDGVTIENGTIKTTDSNKHGIHIYKADNITLKDIDINHTNTNGGAPVVVNGSKAALEGDINITVGKQSWYGINVDSGNNDNAALTVNGTVTVSGDNTKDAIVVESSKVGDTYNTSLNIAKNASVSGNITVRHHKGGDGTVSATNDGTVKGNLTVSAGTVTNNGTISGSVNVSGTGTTFTNTGNTGTITSDGKATVTDNGNKPSNPGGGTVVTPSVTKDRLAGDDRFETAVKVADQLKKELGVTKFNNVVVTYSDEFADALSATALAADKDAPILLINKNDTATAKDYIAKNLVKNGTVYIIGGTTVVPEDFAKSLTDCKVVRLGGADRYETNMEVLKELKIDSQEDIMVASGLKFADALSASATGNPILLVGKTLTTAQKDYLASLGGNDDYYVIGGSVAINTTVENQLKASKLGDVVRVAGDDRYETSAAVADKFSAKARALVIASGADFPDGLTGGVLAAAKNAPLMLVAEGYTDYAADFVDDNRVRKVTAIGGTTVMPNSLVNKVA